MVFLIKFLLLFSHYLCYIIGEILNYLPSSSMNRLWKQWVVQLEIRDCYVINILITHESSYQFKSFQRNICWKKKKERHFLVKYTALLHWCCFLDLKDAVPILFTWRTIGCILQVSDCAPLQKIPLDKGHMANSKVPHFLSYAEAQSMFSRRYPKEDYCLTSSNPHSTHPIVLSTQCCCFYRTFCIFKFRILCFFELKLS